MCFFKRMIFSLSILFSFSAASDARDYWPVKCKQESYCNTPSMEIVVDDGDSLATAAFTIIGKNYTVATFPVSTITVEIGEYNVNCNVSYNLNYENDERRYILPVAFSFGGSNLLNVTQKNDIYLEKFREIYEQQFRLKSITGIKASCVRGELPESAPEKICAMAFGPQSSGYFSQQERNSLSKYITSFVKSDSEINSCLKYASSDLSKINILSSSELDLNNSSRWGKYFFGKLSHVNMVNLFYVKEFDFNVLEKFSGAKAIDLRGAELGDLSFLSKLTNLLSLSLYDSTFSTTQYLKNLRNLAVLDLSNSNAKSLDLSESRELVFLFINNTEISNVDFLRHHEKLVMLGAPNTKIENIDFFLSLDSFTYLDLSYTLVEDFSPLKYMLWIKWGDQKPLIDLSGTKIKDLSVIKNAKGQCLGLANTEVEDIEVLSSTSFAVIDLRNTKINSLKTLSTMTGLKRLFLSEEQMKKLNLKDLLPTTLVTPLRNDYKSVCASYFRFEGTEQMELD